MSDTLIDRIAARLGFEIRDDELTAWKRAQRAALGSRDDLTDEQREELDRHEAIRQMREEGAQ